jgi:sugar-specific transcriptional regulator TrmB
MAEFAEKEVLEDIGLTENEAKVYLTLLETGSTTAGVIVKKTKLHRSTSYEIIRRLIETGMINYVIRAGKRYFEATDPEKFLDVMKEREEKFKRILPQLKMKKEVAKVKQEAYVYEGKKGVKTIFEDVLKTLGKDDEYLIFGAGEPVPMHDYLKIFELRRSKKKIPMKIVFSEGAKLIDYYRKIPYTRVKVLPEENMTPSEVEIYGDKTAIILWGEKPMAFVIENKEVADSFRKYFNLMWEQDVMIHKGFEGIKRSHEKMYEVLKAGEEYYYFGVPVFQKKEQHEYWKKDHEKRAKLGIKGRIMFNQGTNLKILENRNSYWGCDARYMPIDVKTPAWIFGYKDVTIIGIPIGKEVMAIEMINKDVARSFKNYFEAFWRMSKPFIK